MIGLIRSFIAINIPDTVKSELASLILLLGKTGADVKWVRTENLHLTLKFLGGITEDQIRRVIGCLKEIAMGQKPFSIHLAGLSGFPNMEHPRVLWVGIEGGAEAMKELSERIEIGMRLIGFPRKERSFSSHLTMGRVKSGKNLQKLLDLMQKTPFSSMKRIGIDQVSFYKSTLTPAGSVYEVISQCTFGGT